VTAPGPGRRTTFTPTDAPAPVAHCQGSCHRPSSRPGIGITRRRARRHPRDQSRFISYANNRMVMLSSNARYSCMCGNSVSRDTHIGPLTLNPAHLASLPLELAPALQQNRHSGNAGAHTVRGGQGQDGVHHGVAEIQICGSATSVGFACQHRLIDTAVSRSLGGPGAVARRDVLV
jgi:hypothetical protein